MVAQVLLTADVTASENSKRNVENTFRELLNMDIIPVVNENDTVSIDELDGPHFGDNDTLSAVVAKMCRRDRVSEGLGEAMKGLEISEIPQDSLYANRGW